MPWLKTLDKLVLHVSGVGNFHHIRNTFAACATRDPEYRTEEIQVLVGLAYCRRSQIGLACTQQGV